MALKITQMPLPKSPQRSSARRLPIRGMVAHHMTIIGTGTGLANTACRGVWRSREASAHYGVDGKKVAQFLPDNVAAWATADFEGNHGRINVEHANQSGPPTWRISADTLDTGARLFAEKHLEHRLGRPIMNVTMQRHRDFFPTACPGPWFGDSWAAYCRDAQQHYDRIVNGEPATTIPEGDHFDMSTPFSQTRTKDIKLKKGRTVVPLRNNWEGPTSFLTPARADLSFTAQFEIAIGGLPAGMEAQVRVVATDAKGKVLHRYATDEIVGTRGDAWRTVTFHGTCKKGRRLRLEVDAFDTGLVVKSIRTTGIWWR